MFINAEGLDFITLPPDHRGIEFVYTASEETQRRCTYYEILDDSEIEGDEYFTVRLSSSNPLVVVTNEATVTIVDDDGSESTVSAPTVRTSTTPAHAEGICVVGRACVYIAS